MLSLLYSLFIPPQYEVSATPPSSPDTTLTLSASSVNLFITPNSSSVITTDSLVVSVSSSNTGGYTLRMKASDSNPGGVGGTGNHLIHVDNSSFSIPTLNSSTTKTNFPTNYWGYSLDDTTYQPVPASNVTNSGDIIATTNISNPTANSHTIYFSTKADTTLASGVYSNTVEFSAVGNVATVSFDQAFAFHNKVKAQALDTNYYYKMQDMTKDICDAVAHEQQTTLVDTRDSKTYTVFKSKAPDSKCWMNQNLDLDLDTNTPLSNTSTDLNSVESWTPERNMITFGSLNTSTWTNDNYNPYSYEMGDTYYYTSNTTTGDTTYTSLAACEAGGHTRAECMHYHAGNMYNWSAAVASNDTSSYANNYEVMPDSICLRGWRLPRGPENSSDYSDIHDLFVVYGIIATGAPSNAFLTNGFNNVRANPLYFVRSGYVQDGTLVSAGGAGNLHYSSVESASKVYRLGFASNVIYHQDSYFRYVGFPLRCIADNRVNYSLNYAPNGDNVSGLPANQSAFSENTSHSFTTNSAVPTRTGHNFLGYATSADGEVVYQPGASISLNSNSPSITLYAKWGELGFNNSGITTMQAMTPAICTAASQGTTGLLQDTRDGKVYSIFKGNDGRCWMNKSLDLNLSISTTLNSMNTDLNSVSSWAPERDTIPTDSLDATTWVNDNHNPYSHDPGERYYYANGAEIYDINYASLSACTSAGNTAANCKHYHVGNYYNFSATIASNDSSNYIADYEEVPNSICPKGWRLPQGPTNSSDYSDFDDLLAAHNIKTAGASTDFLPDGFSNIKLSPLFFVHAGITVVNQSNQAEYYGARWRGDYWASSIISTSNARGLSWHKSKFYPDEHNRYDGRSIRCVANSTNYMYYLSHDPNGTNVSSLPAGQVARNNNTSHAFIISSTAPTRTGYIFQGYATSADGTVAYQPGDTISTTSATLLLTLYPQWEPLPSFATAYEQAGKSTHNGYYKMQDMTSGICNAVGTGEQATLIDTRDNKTYGVFKANDDRCWMRQNLDLNLSSSVALTNANTDLNNTNSWAPSAPYGGGSTIPPGNLSTKWLNNGNVPYSYDIGNSYDGNLYNWAAAAATNWGAATAQYTIMPNSICPKGWRLPLGPVASGDVSDFADLLSAHGVANPGGGYIGSGFNGMTSNPLSFVRAGYVEGNGGTHYSSGTVGRYWTSVFHSDPDGYMLIFDSGGVYPNAIGKRHQGASVRCVAR